MERPPSRDLAPSGRITRHRRSSPRIIYSVLFLLVASLSPNALSVTALSIAKGNDKPDIEIRSQQFSFSHGAKPDVAIVIEGTEISGSQIRRKHANDAPNPSPSVPTSKPQAPVLVPPKPKPTVSSPLSSLHTTTPPRSYETPVKSVTRSQTSTVWPYELTDELTQQELMTILVAIISSLGLVGLLIIALWYLAWFTWRRMREQTLLVALFSRSATASDLELLMEKSDHAMPLAFRPLAATHLRFVQLLEDVDALLSSTGNISFDDATLEIHGLPSALPSEEEEVEATNDPSPMTFFHILSAIESLQCRGESVAVECTALVIPIRWTRYLDVKWSLDQLKKRMLVLRKRHAEIQLLHQRVVDTLEKRHVDGDVIDQTKLMELVAALRQSPTQTKAPAVDALQLASPLKLRPRRNSKDEFGFFLRSFDELGQQRRVQTGLEHAFGKLGTETETKTESRVAPLNHEVPIIKNEATVVEVKKEEKKRFWSKTATPTPVPLAPPATTTPTTATLLTARLDSNWTQTLETWVDKADELEMTHMDEVKRAQYLLEEAKRESFCLMNSSRDAMQSVESLKTSLVSLGADPKAAVLTAAEIYSSRTNMLMLTTTLRSVFDDFRKGDIIKMEDRRRRHAQKERAKRERIVAKFRMKQLLLNEKIELQRAFEREQFERERMRREKEEIDAFRKETKASRKQFVWMITKLDVLIVLVVMAIVFFESLTRQFELLKPVCVSAAVPSTSLFGLSSSWWPTHSLSLLQCRLEYGLKVTVVFLLGGFAFYIIAQLNLLTTALPVVIAASLYHVRTEWMNMLFRLPVLLVLYGFNSMVLYLLNQSLSEDDPKQPSKVKRRALLLYGGFPLVSVVLSVVVSITIACDDPNACVITAVDVTRRSFVNLWAIAQEAYHL